MRRFQCASLLAAAAFAAGASAVLAGPVTVTGQARSVSISIPPFADPSTAIDETAAAPGNGPFDQTIDRTQSAESAVNTAFASQTSSFGDSGSQFIAAAVGSARYSANATPGILFARSEFSVTFDLAEASPYSLDGSGTFLMASGGATGYSVTLDGPGDGQVAHFADFGPGEFGDGSVATQPFSTSGTLAPGTYILRADAGVSGGINSVTVPAAFELNLVIGEAVGVPPVVVPPTVVPPTVVPLPSGFWAGSLTLCGAAAVVARRRRPAIA